MRKADIRYVFSVLGVLSFVFSLATPTDAFAAKKLVTPEETPFTSTQVPDQTAVTVNASTETGGDISAAAAEPIVAILTVFADPTTGGTGSSGTDGSSAFGTHAFITVRNNSSANINVGKFSGIAPGKTMSIGTWGNKSEHKGLWYNLEAYFISKYASYGPRVSISYGLTSSQLSTLNSFIINNDKWSTLNNCSSFAVKAWNSIATTNYKLSAGTPNTPKKLADNIKANYVLSYRVGEAVPWNYLVYYANGTGSPTKSTVYK